jgi:hypothetical protein
MYVRRHNCIITPFIFLVLVLGLKAQDAEIANLSPVPDRIILNVTEDPAHSMAVNWRTGTMVNKGVAEIALAQDSPFITESKRISARTELLTNVYEGEPTVTAHYHSVMFSDLQPGTKYMYRVGDGETWSEWFHFKTAEGKGKPFSFIYLGDAQNNIKSLWSRVIREAYAKDPNAGFILYAGDLINRDGRDVEWQEWFEGGAFIHASIPNAMTPGNHEYSREMVLDPHWRPQFNLPQNGIKGLEETCYFFDYNDIRVISIDSDMSDEFDWAESGQAQWLDSVLSHNDKKWTALMLHYPFYSTKPSRDNPELRALFGPILEKHQVDIVLQGHDHAYGRGMQDIPSFIDPAKKTNTMFVVSVSGPKMYDLADRSWMSRRAAKTQLYQILRIDGDRLNYKAFTATGELYDEFDLIKRTDAPNKLIDKTPAVAERLE